MNISEPKITQTAYSTIVGNLATSNSKVWDLQRDAVYVSEPHWFDVRKQSWSGGGPFYCVKFSRTHGQGTTNRYRKTGNVYDYTVKGHGLAGFQIPVGSGISADPTWVQARDNASSHYAEGYAQARPGRPEASVAQFIAELKQMPSRPLKGAFKGIRKEPLKTLPISLMERLVHHRRVGNEYLNAHFGWKLFVRDLRQMYYLWEALDKQMAQLVRENGKWINRRATIENDTSSTVSVPKLYPYAYYGCHGQLPNWFGSYPNQSSVVQTHSVTKTKIWFSGNFRYYIPDVGSSQWDRRARKALFGANLTPSLAWELVPWSWLIDWFGNVGDVVSNASPNAVDNLAMRYSYIMKNVVTTVESRCDSQHSAATGTGTFASNWPAVRHSYISRQTVDSKVRVPGGNPFGLGVKWEDLSLHQLGILAALGMSRGTP